MLHQKPFCRYRSIKYSTSQQNLLNKKSIEGNERMFSTQKISLTKESLELQRATKQKRQKNQSFFRIKQYDKENVQTLPRKCNRLLRSKHSSLFETKDSQLEYDVKEQQIEIISLPRYDEYQPFTNYYQHLQEITDTFGPVIKVQCDEVNKIRSQLKIFQRKIDNQIEETQKQGSILLASLRLKISKTFKEHSKQIITTRQILIQMKKNIETIKEKIISTHEVLSDMTKSFTS